MSRVLRSPIYDQIADGVVPLNKGGTNAITAINALANLNAMDNALRDAPNGFALLDQFSHMDPDYIPAEAETFPSVVGVTTAAINSVTQHTINDYDIASAYTLFASNGTISRLGATLTYTAPAAPGVGGFTINGRNYPITITGIGIAQPSITSPVSGATNQSSSVTFTGSAFTVDGGSDTHLNSSWELSLSSTFATLVTSVSHSTTAKTSWSVTGLLANTVYYARVRYTGTSSGDSAWSTTIVLTTRSNFLPVTEVGKLNGGVGPGFGASVALNADATIALVGAYQGPGFLALISGVYVFTRVGSVWTQQQILYRRDPVLYDGFGSSVALNADGTVALIGAYGDKDMRPMIGSVHVFTRVGTVWTEQQKLYASDAIVGHQFGYSVALNADATIALIGAYGDDDTGSVYVMTRLGDVWTQQQKLHASDAAASDYFGMSVALNADATIALIGATGDGGASVDAGAVYVFTRVGTVWTQQQKLHGDLAIEVTWFGYSVALNADASIALISVRTNTSSAIDGGAVYVFTRVGTTWTQQHIIYASDGSPGDFFGSGIAISSNELLTFIGASGAIVNEDFPGVTYIFD